MELAEARRRRYNTKRKTGGGAGVETLVAILLGQREVIMYRWRYHLHKELTAEALVDIRAATIGGGGGPSGSGTAGHIRVKLFRSRGGGGAERKHSSTFITCSTYIQVADLVAETRAERTTRIMENSSGGGKCNR